MTVFYVRPLPCMPYLGQVGGTPDGPPQSFAVGVYSSHMAPHPLPSFLIYRDASSVDIEWHPSIPQLFFSFILLVIISFLNVRSGAQHHLLPEPGVGSSQARTATTPWTLYLFIYLFFFNPAGYSARSFRSVPKTDGQHMIQQSQQK